MKDQLLAKTHDSTADERRMNDGWPDSNIFWRNQRVAVTGRCGVLRVGTFVAEKCQARGAMGMREFPGWKIEDEAQPAH